jgi:hypothetical protein
MAYILWLIDVFYEPFCLSCRPNYKQTLIHVHCCRLVSHDLLPVWGATEFQSRQMLAWSEELKSVVAGFFGEDEVVLTREDEALFKYMLLVLFCPPLTHPIFRQCFRFCVTNVRLDLRMTCCMWLLSLIFLFESCHEVNSVQIFRFYITSLQWCLSLSVSYVTTSYHLNFLTPS